MAPLLNFTTTKKQPKLPHVVSSSSRISPILHLLPRVTGVGFADMKIKDLIAYITLCVEQVFDTCSLDWRVFEKRKDAIETLVNEKGWRIEIHTLNTAIFKDKIGLKLVFGEKPDKKQIREIMKAKKTNVSR